MEDSYSHIVYNAAMLAFVGVEREEIPKIQNIIENPEIGYLTLYKKTNCRCCDEREHAELFAEIILVVTQLSHFEENEIALLTFRTIIQYYLIINCQCRFGQDDTSRKLALLPRKKIDMIFFRAIRIIANHGISRKDVNLTLLSAIARYLALQFGIPEISIVENVSSALPEKNEQ